MAQKFKTLNQSDIFVDTSRITTGIFSNGVGTLAGSSMYTSSISASNKLYYYANISRFKVDKIFDYFILQKSLTLI